MILKYVSARPLTAYGKQVVYSLGHVHHDSGDIAQAIVTPDNQLFTLVDWNDDLMEATYTLQGPAPMTTPATPTPATPDRMTAQDLRAAFARLDEEMQNQLELILEVKNQLETLTAGIQHAATAAATPAPAASLGETVEFVMDVVTMSTDDNGKVSYKARGGRYTQFGVRIWPEVLPVLGIDPASLVPGPNPINPPVNVRASTKAKTDEVTGEVTTVTVKVTGKA